MAAALAGLAPAAPGQTAAAQMPGLAAPASAIPAQTRTARPAPLGDSASDPIARGIAAFGAREPAAALAAFQDALARDSTSYEANWRAALACITLGAATPDRVESPARDSLYHSAELYARRAVRADSMGAEGQFVLANALGRTALTRSRDERIRLAAEIRSAALRAIALDPRHDGAYHVLGLWNAEIMRLSGFSRFLARHLMGGGIFGQASWDGAIDNMRRAVELDSTRIVHHLDLAKIYVDRKRWGDARAELDTVTTLPVRDYLDPQYKGEAAALRGRISGRR